MFSIVLCLVHLHVVDEPLCAVLCYEAGMLMCIEESDQDSPEQQHGRVR